MRIALAALALLVLSPAALAAETAPPPNIASPTPAEDELPPGVANDVAVPGELDGSWRIVLDDGGDMPLVALDITHGADEPRAAGVFTALPGLCPDPATACDWDGVTAEITDIVLVDGGLIISFNPSADVADEQVFHLKPVGDGSWRGTLEGQPPRRVLMRRPPE
ncbi:hypothetical protein [Zavarzinia aquatilis]|uniref:Alkaline proteinase inhibitor/ Outer membrane lipoprotein Omp19 domain-containing protein n=1 Tax=Zavarzinia aquatilis TaxID=2211142 RepID=A0A317EC16_9PROT|nr:hypothetical protein [Zavarzinia aquatilis]PWR24162.1 hypothetical protein DKG74_08545 [Zavarzinia aquatilis]